MIFVVFDLEATCWLGRPPKGSNEIIEIGAVLVNKFGEELSRFSRFIRPTVNPLLSGFCKNLTSINQEDVDRAQDFPRVFKDFEDWIFDHDSEILLCSWGSFDKQLIINDCRLHKMDYDWVEDYIDIKGQYHENRGLTKHGGLKKTVKLEGFDFTGIHHRAISDAENLAKIVSKYIDEWYY